VVVPVAFLVFAFGVERTVLAHAVADPVKMR
jgi:hypothetical protein